MTKKKRLSNKIYRREHQEIPNEKAAVCILVCLWALQFPFSFQNKKTNIRTENVELEDFARVGGVSNGTLCLVGSGRRRRRSHGRQLRQGGQPWSRRSCRVLRSLVQNNQSMVLSPVFLFGWWENVAQTTNSLEFLDDFHINEKM